MADLRNVAMTAASLESTRLFLWESGLAQPFIPVFLCQALILGVIRIALGAQLRDGLLRRVPRGRGLPRLLIDPLSARNRRAVSGVYEDATNMNPRIDSVCQSTLSTHVFEGGGWEPGYFWDWAKLERNPPA